MLGQIALVVAAGLLGPILAAGRRPLLPVVVGELVGGVVLGRTGLGIIDPGASVFPIFYELGFALLMFTAGTHVDIASPAFRSGATRGVLALLAAGAAAVAVGWMIATVLGFGHFLTVAVLLAGSSAAVAFPIIEERKLSGPPIAFLIAWIAIADSVTVVLLPLTLVGSGKLAGVLGGTVAILAVGGVVYALGAYITSSEVADTVRERSLARGWGLELRLSMILMLALTAIADRTGASTMVAGFVAGMVLIRLHHSQRLDIQLSGVANGLFVPIFFVLLGARLDLRALLGDTAAITVAIVMGVGAVVVHLAAATATARERRVATGLAASAQLGLPAAAASLGLASQVLKPPMAAALVAGACLTLIPASVGSFMLSNEVEAA
jgi:Kef-type K+ transport system membrane component KefB